MSHKHSKEGKVNGYYETLMFHEDWSRIDTLNQEVEGIQFDLENAQLEQDEVVMLRLLQGDLLKLMRDEQAKVIRAS